MTTTQHAPVHVRTYSSAKEYAADVPVMAGQGWIPASQLETSVGPSGAAALVGGACVLVGLLVHFGLLVIGVLLVIVAFVGRPKQIVVTYRPAASDGP